MSDLEEAGLLKQPHTSAGRVPTDQGLRFFVDSLLKVRTLSEKERVELSQRYQIPGDDIESALREAACARKRPLSASMTIMFRSPSPQMISMVIPSGFSIQRPRPRSITSGVLAITAN